jgi:hypothetical protein
MWEKTRLYPWAVKLSPGRIQVEERRLRLDITLEESEKGGLEVVTGVGSAFTWTRKQIVRAHGTARTTGGELPVATVALIDDNAGYHPRHTRWHWSGGAGKDSHGRDIAWSVIVGLNDSPVNSERSVWIDGVPHEVGPVHFAEDLSSVTFADGSALRFQQEAVRQRRDNLLLIRSQYRQPFGVFSGSLPGGIEVAEAFGVMEFHDAYW